MPELERLGKMWHNLRWLPSFLWQSLSRGSNHASSVHLIIGIADHFEPSILPGIPGASADQHEQERRVEHWCQEYPRLADEWRDSDGHPFRHTYFYPAEQYNKTLIERLADHCRSGWGEIEIHLHHGVTAPDTPENTHRTLVEFRDILVRQGCLSRMDAHELPRYAFVHGNWALANSDHGRCCGVDEEMRILAETGCFADLTLPSAPHPAQVTKINSLYECSGPLDRRAPHRHGRDLRRGRPPARLPLIIQGPLTLNFSRKGKARFFPRIENGEITSVNPPTRSRLNLWRKAQITVIGRPDWLFIKLHCHGMDPRDRDCLLGEPMRRFLRDLVMGALESREYEVHFVTAREMVNIVLAACDGLEGNPGEYRDYRLKRIVRSVGRPPNTGFDERSSKAAISRNVVR